jgi:[ribosomal protein S5]-alanine N-acetyltransferase
LAVTGFRVGIPETCGYARHDMFRNPASGRVLEKIGMKREGLLRERVRKWGVFEDVMLLAAIKKDWSDRKRPS